ncbi:CDGSH iron-sulfur domain-containing protein [Actinotalea ferrariae]|uniref:CDGSH iron-sulfur domain-containing protein n=1 Tax=Actinotalea ferrariae TaxID=1386098 RepID=UPI001C8C9A40|nr:CDGSH iron-sulfur domain-containing protein [Actinotalea ferrariae]MBX9245696.1 CDGSH iron-sulfur domain-containing protein [Actinotalea ferrariae]
MTISEIRSGRRREPDDTTDACCPPDDAAVPGASGAPGEKAGWASITACPNGPLLVRGDVEIMLASGQPAPRRRRTVALCRCGASGIKPYCDGSHKVIGFTTDDEPV